MKKIDLVFCILQYKAATSTVACIESIKKKCKGVSYQIIVIDNASPDNSVQIIRDLSSKDRSIKLIVNHNNMGFARGNNVGIKFAKSNYLFDFLIVMNNDTKLLQDDLYNKLEREYQKSNFSLLGPMILTGDGRFTTNPSRSKLLSIDELKKKLNHEKRLYYFYRIDILGLLSKIRQMKNIFKEHKNIESDFYLTRQENVQLQGSFLVFSQTFFERISGFDDSTYMYMEEYFLFKHLVELGMLSVYLPEIKIFHSEDVSTKEARKSNRSKELFLHKNSWESAKKLLILYRQFGDNQ